MKRIAEAIQMAMSVRGWSVEALAIRAYMSPAHLYRRLAMPETFTLGEFAAVAGALGWKKEHAMGVLEDAITAYKAERRQQ